MSRHDTLSCCRGAAPLRGLTTDRWLRLILRSPTRSFSVDSSRVTQGLLRINLVNVIVGMLSAGDRYMGGQDAEVADRPCSQVRA
jgi:hypothetical protein